MLQSLGFSFTINKSLVVALSRGAVLVVLLVELTTALISDGVGRVSRSRGSVDRLSEERFLRRSSVSVALSGGQHGIRSRRLSLLTAAAAAADAEDESEKNEASTGADENHQSEARNLALQVTV